MEKKMATVNKAQELIEELRSASWNYAIQGNYAILINNCTGAFHFKRTFELLSAWYVPKN